MTKYVSLLSAAAFLTLSAPSVQADDFGNRFGNTAPYALNNGFGKAMDDQQGIGAEDLNRMEPAAGDVTIEADDIEIDTDMDNEEEVIDNFNNNNIDPDSYGRPLKDPFDDDGYLDDGLDNSREDFEDDAGQIEGNFRLENDENGEPIRDHFADDDDSLEDEDLNDDDFIPDDFENPEDDGDGKVHLEEGTDPNDIDTRVENDPNPPGNPTYRIQDSMAESVSGDNFGEIE